LEKEKDKLVKKYLKNPKNSPGTVEILKDIKDLREELLKRNATRRNMNSPTKAPTIISTTTPTTTPTKTPTSTIPTTPTKIPTPKTPTKTTSTIPTATTSTTKTPTTPTPKTLTTPTTPITAVTHELPQLQQPYFDDLLFEEERATSPTSTTTTATANTTPSKNTIHQFGLSSSQDDIYSSVGGCDYNYQGDTFNDENSLGGADNIEEKKKSPVPSPNGKSKIYYQEDAY
jgi:hypothetical protein